MIQNGEKLGFCLVELLIRLWISWSVPRNCYNKNKNTCRNCLSSVRRCRDSQEKFLKLLQVVDLFEAVAVDDGDD